MNVEDFLYLLQHWGPCPPAPADCPSDLDGDGWIGAADFLILLAHWT